MHILQMSGSPQKSISKIILPISNNYTTNLQIPVMQKQPFVSASLPKVKASFREIILLISE